jgi:hypothetical protein
VYNIKKAVSRLDFAPKIDDIRVTDIKKGIGTFVPKPDKAVSFAALKSVLKKAGYTLDSAEITVSGALIREGPSWLLEADASRQRFLLQGPNVPAVLSGAAAGEHIEVKGDWSTSDDASVGETIQPRTARRIRSSQAAGGLGGIQVSLDGVGPAPAPAAAPVRTTSPGLTVYKGGAIVPRYSITDEHLGNLRDTRQTLKLALSYTPTPTIQLEAEVPIQYLSFSNGVQSVRDRGVGNPVLWGKYRFYRVLETWGDKQAAVRVGVELPVGSTATPGPARLAAPDFIRQQLSPIAGGAALHTEVTYSQAYHRLIYGADVEGTIRGERDGYRLGNEVRLNTDLEWVLLPRDYQSPGKELFAILETTFVGRDRGRSSGLEVPGSSSTGFYLAPGFQFTATPRLVIEGSYQFPIVLNSGPLALRTSRSVLFGMRYLY